MSSNWCFGLVEGSFVKLTEKGSKRTHQFLLKTLKWWERNICVRKFFTTNCCIGEIKSSSNDTAEFFLSKCQKKIRSSLNDEQWWAKKRTYSKKNSFNTSPWQVVSTFDKPANCFPTEKKPLFFVQCSRRMKKHTKKFVKTIICLQNDPSDSRKQCRQIVRKKICKKTAQFAINVGNWWEK